MFRSLHSKLLFYFFILSLLSIFLMSIAFRLSFDECFTIYLDNKREEEIERFMNKLHDVYLLEGKSYKKALSETSELKPLLSYQAVTENLFYEVISADGTVILDSTHLMTDLLNITVNDENKRETFADFGYYSDTRPFLINGDQVGTVISYYKLGYKKGEFQFKERLNKYILVAEMTMIAIAVLVSFFFSNKLTLGLRRVRDTARELLRRNLSVRMPVKGLPEEVQQVAASFNELAESLSQQDKLRKQFSTDLAHEFRTPIATLRSQIEALQDKIWEPTPEKLNQIHAELMRLVRLVDELEKLMAVENPKLQLNMEPISLNEKLAIIRDDHLPLFRKKNIEFTMKDLPANKMFLADHDRFVQIISNLLNNAYKYTDEGGRVTIRAYENDGYLHIQIEDTGVGISSEDLPYVFERFYRGDKSRDRKTGGIGIGLSIVKALVVAQGGTIEIESQLYEGTKVTVSFKIAVY